MAVANSFIKKHHRLNDFWNQAVMYELRTQ